MKGKNGYHIRHFMHDGMICGYDQNEMTYSVYAYDFHMRLRVFFRHLRDALKRQENQPRK